MHVRDPQVHSHPSSQPPLFRQRLLCTDINLRLLNQSTEEFEEFLFQALSASLDEDKPNLPVESVVTRLTAIDEFNHPLVVMLPCTLQKKKVIYVTTIQIKGSFSGMIEL